LQRWQLSFKIALKQSNALVSPTAEGFGQKTGVKRTLGSEVSLFETSLDVIPTEPGPTAESLRNSVSPRAVYGCPTIKGFRWRCLAKLSNNPNPRGPTAEGL
jgi:hypothetical protein